MQAPIRSIVMVSALLLWAAAPASPQGRYHRGDGRIAAYLAGSDDGYRIGLRDGLYDCRAGYGYGYRGRDHLRWDGHHAFGRHNRGEFRKGFRDGYRQGYQEGFRSRGWGRVRPFNRFR